MPVPKYYQFFPSILDCLADGKEHNLKEVAEYCANKFNLSDEDKREALPSGQPTYLNRVGWARTYLKKAGVIDRTSRSVYVITDLGEEAVKNGSSNVILNICADLIPLMSFQIPRILSRTIAST